MCRCKARLVIATFWLFWSLLKLAFISFSVIGFVFSDVFRWFLICSFVSFVLRRDTFRCGVSRRGFDACNNCLCCYAARRCVEPILGLLSWDLFRRTCLPDLVGELDLSHATWADTYRRRGRLAFRSQLEDRKHTLRRQRVVLLDRVVNRCDLLAKLACLEVRPQTVFVHLLPISLTNTLQAVLHRNQLLHQWWCKLRPFRLVEPPVLRIVQQRLGLLEERLFVFDVVASFNCPVLVSMNCQHALLGIADKLFLDRST